jgi:hypothetical protein
MARSKTHQLRRTLGITDKSAWFLTHRIREATRAGGLLPPMGGGGKPVEVDETLYGRLEGAPKKGRHVWANKNAVLTLVERRGAVRSFHIDGVRAGEILPIIHANLSREAQMITDEIYFYKYIEEATGISHDRVTQRKNTFAARATRSFRPTQLKILATGNARTLPSKPWLASV